MTVRCNKSPYKYGVGVLPSEARVTKGDTYNVKDVDVFYGHTYYILEGEDILYRADLFSVVDLDEDDYTVVGSEIKQ